MDKFEEKKKELQKEFEEKKKRSEIIELLKKNEYSKVLAIYPENMYALQKLADISYDSKNYEEALELLSKLIKIAPENAFFLRRRGQCFYQIDKYEEAIEDFNNALEIDPDDKESLRLKSLSYKYLEEKNSSNRFFESDKNLKFKLIDEEFEFEHWPTGTLGVKSRGNPMGLYKINSVWNYQDPFAFEGYPKLESIPDFLSEDELMKNFYPEGNGIGANVVNIVDTLNYFKRSHINQEIEVNNVFNSSKNEFMEFISKFGLFSGKWINVIYKKKIYEKFLNEVRSEERLRHLNHMINHAYFGQNNNYQNIKGDNWEYKEKDILIWHLTHHVLWQLILFSMEEKNTMQIWIDKFSGSENCVRCNNVFTPILINPRHFFNTNGNSIWCYNCIKLDSPKESEILKLVSELVDIIGSPPPDGITPIDPRVTFFNSHRKQIDIIDSYCKLGGISYAKYTLQKSWLSILNDSGSLPNGELKSSSYGIMCIAKDGHECRSLAEKIIDDYLYENNISHETEPVYPKDKVLNPTRMRADWKIGETYYEYFGLVGKKDYDKKIIKKFELGEKLRLKIVGIFPDDIYSLDKLFKS